MDDNIIKLPGFSIDGGTRTPLDDVPDTGYGYLASELRGDGHAAKSINGIPANAVTDKYHGSVQPNETGVVPAPGRSSAPAVPGHDAAGRQRGVSNADDAALGGNGVVVAPPHGSRL